MHLIRERIRYTVHHYVSQYTLFNVMLTFILVTYMWAIDAAAFGYIYEGDWRHCFWLQIMRYVAIDAAAFDYRYVGDWRRCFWLQICERLVPLLLVKVMWAIDAATFGYRYVGDWRCCFWLHICGRLTPLLLVTYMWAMNVAAFICI